MLERSITQIRRNILEAAYAGKEGHIASSFSILDILYVLYKNVMCISPNIVNSDNRDVLILSKGHASLAHAAVLEHFDFITKEDLNSYCKFDSILGGHLDRKKVPGVEVSTGSLGHGVSVSIGIALACKIKNILNRIFVIVGDGECNEGSFWESLLLASNHNLDNLTFIIDYNRSNDRALKLDPLREKLIAFGWQVDLVDGHNHSELENVLSLNSKQKPHAVVANTIKGKGVKVMENNPEWHHKTPSDSELKKMLEELK